MRLAACAIALSVLLSFLCARPSEAEWKDSLVRAVAPRLVDRGLNYIFKRRPASTAKTPAQEAAAKKAATQQPVAETPSYLPLEQAPYYPPGTAVPTYTKSATGKLPPPPVITAKEMGPAPKSSTLKVAKSKLAVPPDPNQMVPPPPPSPPTGAILGMYPVGDDAAVQPQIELTSLPPTQPEVSLKPRTSPAIKPAHVPVQQEIAPNQVPQVIAPAVIPKPAPDFRRNR